jgi:hypothetical protein
MNSKDKMGLILEKLNAVKVADGDVKKEPKTKVKSSVKDTPSVSGDDLKMLLALVDAYNRERDTKVYTMTPGQRNVVNTMTNGYHSREKMKEGYDKTLGDGFFNASFNDKGDAVKFIKDLEMSIDKKGAYEIKEFKGKPNPMLMNMSYVEHRLVKVK